MPNTNSRVARPRRTERRGAALGAILAALVALTPATALAGRIRYTVAPGDTLGRIADEYNVTPAQIRRWNSLRTDGIRAGQQLTIYTSGGSGERVRETYTVRSGDSGLSIARRLRVAFRDLERWNPNRNMDRLSPGDRIYYYVDDGGSDAQGRGTPQRGRLRNPTQLVSANGFVVASAERAWGTDLTVGALTTGLADVQSH
ncbi:MAG: LysM peptidoglycan-binding domain-containing protein, partial [Myxococcales bacterium]|nr:LysM peptidoglycan-binding domain-containing protein [Myxococcales bacterium]